jgi:hypothetical protein
MSDSLQVIQMLKSNKSKVENVHDGGDDERVD